MDKRPIGVFDSGLGGLTCVKQLQAIMPNEDIVYLGDTGRVPYGTRSAETIIKYANQDIEFLKSKNVKLIVIACGTVSSVALPHIDTNSEPPIIGVVDCTAYAAAKTTKNGKIAVLGTPSTIKSKSYVNRLHDADPNLSVTSVACPMFVPLVENGYIDANNTITTLVAQQYLAKIKENVDTVILGCTHYPLIKGCLQKLMPGATLIDSGKEAAMLAKKKLETRNMLSDDTPGVTRYYVTDSVENFAQVGSIFLNKAITGNVERVDIS